MPRVPPPRDLSLPATPLALVRTQLLDSHQNIPFLLRMELEWVPQLVVGGPDSSKFLCVVP